jgi:1-acyl-sn-glycerol-3-phosphate acyltransferase
MRYPGVIHARFLPAIEPGLDKEAFMERLIAETEAATDALLVEAARSDDPPPMPPTAAARLRALGVEAPAG